MIVIPPSFEILDVLDGQSMATRIESCGRICYKSEDKITEESAGPFINNILKRKHNSVAEMAVITLEITGVSGDDAASLYGVIPKYIAIDQLEDTVLVLTGSVRAFRELFIFHGEVEIVKEIACFWGDKYPQFFSDLEPETGWCSLNKLQINRIKLSDVDRFSGDMLLRHRHLAVKFITNRAVTHENVRHRPCAYLQESQRYCRYDKAQFGNQVTFIKPMFFADGSPEYRLWEKAMIQTEELYLELLKTATPQAARTVLPNSCKTEIIVFCSLGQWRHIFKLRTPSSAEPSMRELMIPLQKELIVRFPVLLG